MALELLQQQAELGLAPAKVVADMQYASGELRAQAEAQGEGTTIVTKAAARADSGYLSKAEFHIDLEACTVTCPAGEVARFPRFRPGLSTEAVFAAAACATCPLMSRCVQKPGKGRIINIHSYEDQLQAAPERRSSPDFDEVIRKRPTVERKQAHWNRKGGARSRSCGFRRNPITDHLFRSNPITGSDESDHRLEGGPSDSVDVR